MSTVLVTGAAGFIGSHVCESLLRRGDAVVGLDDVNDYYPVAYKRQNLEELLVYPRFRFVETDLVDTGAVQQVFCDHAFASVAHLGARAGVRPSIAEPQRYIQANIVGTANILEAARQTGVPHLVFTSSSSVYGDSRDVPYREDDSATDRPISPYAATKKAGEVMCHAYHVLHGLHVNVVRPFTVYGPRGRPDMAPWLFVEAAFSHRPVRKFGDGTTARDYTFIDDFVSGFLAALDRPMGFEVFNLGNSHAVELNRFLQIVEATTNRHLSIQHEPIQPGDVQITLADLTRARSKLDYAPGTSLEDGMQQFVAWYRQRFPSRIS